MSGYAIIKDNVEFNNPERIGLRFNSVGFSDVLRIYPQIPRHLRSSAEAVSMLNKPHTMLGKLDEWGCRWDAGHVSDGGYGLVVENPLKDLKQMDQYVFPDPMAAGRFDGLEAALSQADGRYVQLNSPYCMFERMHFLRGFDKVLLDLYADRDFIEYLADQLIEYQIGIVKEAGRLGKGRIHCFDTTDDWGTQNNIFIRPDMWRRIFKPRYQRLIDCVHRNGMHFRFHSDGKINSILGDFVELGVDIFNIHQPRLLGIQDVRDQLRGKICIEASVDIQATLPSNNKKLIEEEVKAIVENWATKKGGLIGVEYRHLNAIGASKEALEWELACFKKYGSSFGKDF